LYPVFFKNTDEIDNERLELFKNIEELKKEKNLHLSLEGEKIEPPIFNISYDQYENLEINNKIVEIFREIYPELNQKFEIKKEN